MIVNLYSYASAIAAGIFNDASITSAAAFTRMPPKMAIIRQTDSTSLRPESSINLVSIMPMHVGLTHSCRRILVQTYSNSDTLFHYFQTFGRSAALVILL